MSVNRFSSSRGNLPKSVSAVLWSYKPEQIDIEKHKKIIIFQVLNFGSEEAIKWLFKQYGVDLITKVVNDIPVSQWDKKSLSLWRLVLSINLKDRRI